MRDGQSRWARCESVEAAQGKEKGSKAMGTSLCVFIDSSLRNWSGHPVVLGSRAMVGDLVQASHSRKMNALFWREEFLSPDFTDDSHQRDARRSQSSG